MNLESRLVHRTLATLQHVHQHDAQQDPAISADNIVAVYGSCTEICIMCTCLPKSCAGKFNLHSSAASAASGTQELPAHPGLGNCSGLALYV